MRHLPAWRHVTASLSTPQSLRSFTSTGSLQYAGKDLSAKFSMRGRSVLVTGGARGMGLSISQAIMKQGGNVAVMDTLPEPPQLQEFAARYETQTIYKQIDITNRSALETAFEDIVTQLDLTGLVSAAGINYDVPFLEHGYDESQRLLAVNVMGTFWPVKLIAKHMVEKRLPGSIVMVSSIGGNGNKLPGQNLAIYQTSKAAIRGLAGPLSVELAPNKIRVNTLSPGPIMTPMAEEFKATQPEFFKVFESLPPAGRLGSPEEDIAPAVLYLLSDASAYVTGTDLTVSGGYHAGLNTELVKEKITGR